MGRSRRAFLTGTTGIAVASAGCLSRFSPWGDSGGGEEEGTTGGGNGNKGGHGGEQESTNTDQPGQRNESDNNSNASNGERTEETNETEGNATADASEGDIHDESDLHPNDSETKHSGEYNKSGQHRETVDRPQEHVSISNRDATVDNQGGVTVTADCMNASSEPIDAIDVYVEYYVGEEYRYGDSDVIRDLGPNESETVTSHAPGEQVYAESEEIGVNIEVVPYDYARSGE